MQQNDWKEIEKQFIKVFNESHKNNYPFDCWEAFDGLKKDIKSFFHTKFTEVFEEGKKVGREELLSQAKGSHLMAIEEGKKVGRAEVLSQIKGLATEKGTDLVEVAKLLNKLNEKERKEML